MLEQLAYRVGNLLKKEQYLSDMESEGVDTCLNSCSDSLKNLRESERSDRQEVE